MIHNAVDWTTSDKEGLVCCIILRTCEFRFLGGIGIGILTGLMAAIGSFSLYRGWEPCPAREKKLYTLATLSRLRIKFFLHHFSRC